MLDFIINLIYPNVCGICGKVCKNDICNKCLVKLKKYKECKKHIYLTRNFTTHMYIFRYEELIRNSIIQYKFSDKAYMYKTFAEIILKDKKVCGFLKSYDIIIPVPISKKRNNSRGYNQSELIIKQLKRNINEINLQTNILYKIKDTLPQSKLDKEHRKNNLNGAYEVRNNKILQDKKILLFDDIFTTGSTADECSKILKNAGAYEVGILTLAKD